MLAAEEGSSKEVSPVDQGVGEGLPPVSTERSNTPVFFCQDDLFDEIVGTLQGILITEEFQNLQNAFFNKHSGSLRSLRLY